MTRVLEIPRRNGYLVPLFVAGLGSFVTAAGFSAVGLALPRISDTFGIDVTVAQWISLVQSLAMTAFLLPSGWLGDRYGQARVYALGMGIFGLGAILSGIAPAFLPLVLARVITTFGTALMTALTPAITISLVPPDRRGQALGWTVTFTYVGLAFGPTIGGLVMAVWDWRAALMIAAPPAFLLMIASLRWLPADAASAHRGQLARTPFDTVGAILLTVGFGSLLLVLTRGASWGWSSPAAVGLVITGVLGVSGFVWWERRVADPLLDLGLFRNRFFSLATLSAVFLYLGGWVPPFLVPFYLIDARGFAASEAGIVLATFSITTMLTAPFAGTFSDRIGSRWLTTGGMVFVTAGLLLFGTLDQGSSSLDVAIRLVIAGIGIGLFVTPNNSALLSSVRPDQRGTVSALTGTARNIGMATGVAIAGTIYGALLADQAGAIGESAAHIVALRTAYWVVAGVTAFGIATSLRR